MPSAKTLPALATAVVDMYATGRVRGGGRENAPLSTLHRVDVVDTVNIATE